MHYLPRINESINSHTPSTVDDEVTQLTSFYEHKRSLCSSAPHTTSETRSNAVPSPLADEDQPGNDNRLLNKRRRTVPVQVKKRQVIRPFVFTLMNDSSVATGQRLVPEASVNAEEEAVA